MSGYDAQFVYDERPTEPQHTLKVSIYSAEASARYSFDGAKRELRGRLRDLPPLRWRAVRVPLDLHHPVWVEDPELDVERHVFRLVLRAPGGRRELCDAISRVTSRPLDPNRPLWEMWMLEGYQGGRIVSVLKMSHALADGGASRELLERLYSQRPVAAPTTGSAPLPSESLPSRWTLVRDALRDRLRDAVVELPRLVRASLAARRRFRAARRSGDLPDGGSLPLLRWPHTPFSGSLSRRRAFHFTSVPLDDARKIRRARDCTINDVVLATVAGAARRYLLAHGALPDLPTLGYMPVSIRERHEVGTWGNHFTAQSVALPTQLECPLARLRAVARATARIKAEVALRRGALFEEWMGRLPPVVLKVLSYTARTLAQVHPHAPGSICVSSVRGPAERLHTLGGPVENFISVGHMKYSAGLNVTVWSYADRLNFGLYACARAVPDLWRISEQIDAAFEELLEAATCDELNFQSDPDEKGERIAPVRAGAGGV
jgi:WS/DGAT/MGAT family acyltransferase